MAKDKISAKELQEIIDRANAVANRNIELLKEERSQMSSIFDMRKKIANQEEIINQERIKQENIIKILNKYETDGIKIHGNKLKSLQNERKESEKIVKQSERRLTISKGLLVNAKNLKNAFFAQKGFLMAADAAIKGINLELGLSGERASIMRENFQDSAQFAARMGVDLEGLANMTRIYAEETGRARLHNEANLKALTLIAKGTALGQDGAAQLAANFEMFGFNATDTAKEVQRIVDTTERMGVNTGKVLKAVNKNFKTLQKFTFRNGSQGIADMATYATKFKMNMDEVLSSMEKGRALDSVIEMSAQLQVLGGQFANLADPMAMLFESRNDPVAYTKRINEMTKGMVTMNKTAEGFEMQIASPMAQDQLANAAKALGMSTDELTQQAFRAREIQQIRSQMFGKGFTGKEKELIEGLAKFDKNTGRMMVEIGGAATDVSSLTTDQIRVLQQEQKTLEERAKESQTFDQAMKNTIMELKSALLPMLQGVNSLLKKARPVIETITNFFNDNDWAKNLLGAAGMMMGAGMLWKTFISPLTLAAKAFSSVGGGGIGRGIGKSVIGDVAGDTAKGASSAGKGVAKGAGGGMLKGGLGIGGAALGIGGGIGIAALGISKLSDSMSKLNTEQLKTLQNIIIGLGVAIPALAGGMLIFGKAAETSALGIGILTAAVLGVGTGIGVAANGIGYMAEGLSRLDGVDLSGIGTGMLSIGGAALMMGNPFSIAGLGALTASAMAIGSEADKLERVGNAFYNIATVLKGDSSQFDKIKETIKSIASIDMNDNSVFGELKQLLSQPLKVEFSEKEVGFVANIDLRMGDTNFITEISKKIPARIVDLQQAKS